MLIHTCMQSIAPQDICQPLSRHILLHYCASQVSPCALPCLLGPILCSAWIMFFMTSQPGQNIAPITSFHPMALRIRLNSDFTTARYSVRPTPRRMHSSLITACISGAALAAIFAVINSSKVQFLPRILTLTFCYYRHVSMRRIVEPYWR